MSPSHSLGESTVLHLRCVWQGFQDAFKWNIVISAIIQFVSSCKPHLFLYKCLLHRDAELRGNVLKSAAVNLLSLVFIYVFDLLLLPLVHQPSWFHQNIGWIYQVFWLFPVMTISLYLNVSSHTIISCALDYT